MCLCSAYGVGVSVCALLVENNASHWWFSTLSQFFGCYHFWLQLAFFFVCDLTNWIYSMFMFFLFCLWHFCCILSCLAILIDLIHIPHLYISTWHFWNLLYSTLNIYMPYENKNAIGSCRFLFHLFFIVSNVLSV